MRLRINSKRTTTMLSIVTIAMLVMSSTLLLLSTTPASAKDYQSLVFSERGETMTEAAMHGVNSPSNADTARTPSVLSQGQDVVTAQGAASSLQVRQSNNLVNTQAYYDIQFKTSTTGAIKTIEMIFPEGTYLGAVRTLEVEGIGPGVPIGEWGSNRLIYSVNSPEVIPAGTKIRLDFVNINNSPIPSNTHTVEVTTRDSSSIIIDGPTVSPVFVLKQIGTNDVANNAITASKISPTFMTSRILQDGQNGWNPDAVLDPATFTITDTAVKASNSHVYVSVDEPADVGPLAINVVCMVEDIENSKFEVVCDLPPSDGSVLRYTVINQP